jgi:hypothetical protein
MHAHHTAAPRRVTSPQPHSTHRRHHGRRSIAHQLSPETIERPSGSNAAAAPAQSSSQSSTAHAGHTKTKATTPQSTMQSRW